MVRAKNYETKSAFAEVMQKNCGLFFRTRCSLPTYESLCNYTTLQNFHHYFSRVQLYQSVDFLLW